MCFILGVRGPGFGCGSDLDSKFGGRGSGDGGGGGRGSGDGGGMRGVKGLVSVSGDRCVALFLMKRAAPKPGVNCTDESAFRTDKRFPYHTTLRPFADGHFRRISIDC